MSRLHTPSRRRRSGGLAKWWKRARVTLSQSWSEHPVFALDEDDEPASDGAVSLGALSEEQRGPLFGQHLMRMYRARLRVTSAIGLLFLPSFTAFYFYLFPATSRGVPAVCALGMTVAFVTLLLTFAVKTLGAARALALISFFLFSLSCALVIPLVTLERALRTEGGRAVQMVVMVSFIHILITSLIIPFRAREAIGLSAVILGTMGYGFHLAPSGLGAATMIAELFVVGTVALLIVILSHFNSRLRRRVFDASFDMAMQAARMKAMSQTDALTGGSNRHHIERVLVTELARAARFERPLSVLMFDLDNFKIVNDTLGHGAGDEVLQAIHQAASNELREIDTLARFGGDEFVILLPETDANYAQRIAKRLHARIAWELPVRFGENSLPGQVSLSIGALTLEVGHRLSASAILARVDELLYSAKNNGKNQVVAGVEGE